MTDIDNPRIGEIYNKIGKFLFDTVSGEYQEYVLIATDLTDNHAKGYCKIKRSLEGEYEDSDTKVKFEILYLVNELRNLIKKDDSKKFTGMRFSLFPDGNFNVSFTYDN